MLPVVDAAAERNIARKHSKHSLRLFVPDDLMMTAFYVLVGDGPWGPLGCTVAGGGPD